MFSFVSASTLIVIAVAVVLLVAIVVWLWPNSPKSSEKMANKRLGDRARFNNASAERRLQDARTNLHPDCPTIGPGLVLGSVDSSSVFQGWRQCSVQIHAPGRGKTTSQVVPHSKQAPGPLVMTSNKADGVWEVFAARMFHGNVWIFDPTNILNRKDASTDHFNIIGMVRNSMDAEKVGAIFQAATQGEGSREGNPNAHFDLMGSKIIGSLLLAANVSGGSDKDVFRWAMTTDEDEPAAILERHGFTNQAATLRGLKKQPADTRGSVWATAQRCASPFEHEEYLASIRPVSEYHRVFDPVAFASSTDTLILLGSRTAGATSALVSSLVWDVFRSAKVKASTGSNERLRVPMVMELDEVGNTVMLPELPEWYSYSGSLGIVINSYFQSVAQGRRVYGEEGMDELIGAASVLVYGGGGTEEEFVSSLSKIIGQYDHKVKTHSSSYNARSGHGRSSSDQVQRREILSAADLSNMSPGSMYVRTSDGGGGVVQAHYWFEDKQMVEELKPRIERLKAGLKQPGSEREDTSHVK